VIGLIDVDNKLPNLALMKISTYFNDLGVLAEFVKQGGQYEKIYASAIFSRSKGLCDSLVEQYGDKIEIGGTGWDITKTLPAGIHSCRADYSLYSAEMIANRIRIIGTKQRRIQKATEIVNAGIGFTSRGCIRRCSFCIVPSSEGAFRQEQEIGDIINPCSNVIMLHDNNFTADPYCIDKLHEIRDRKLIVDINQGCDVRLMTDEIAQALSEVRHLRSLHYAWDLMAHESGVVRGIETLKKFVKAYRHMCFMLVGFDTTFEEDCYRFRKLLELNIKPYVMLYNEIPDVRLRHFRRWVNFHAYKVCSFDEYEPWIRDQKMYFA